MSVILITKHDENIYNVVTPEQEEKMKQDLDAICTRAGAYESKFQKYRDDFVKGKKPCGIMGTPEQLPPDPANYLRKRTGKPLKTTVEPDKHPEDLPEIPKKHVEPTPTFEECKKRILVHSSKDFIRQNIKHIAEMKPKEPEQKIVIDRVGNAKLLKRGLEPIYIHAKNFGRAPRYLLDIINANKRKYMKLKESSGFQKPKCRYICREERTLLLEGLKQNWEELQKQYQGLPILTDTIPKIARKTRIESNLRQLEKDIQLIERHPYLYVYDDDNFP